MRAKVGLSIFAAGILIFAVVLISNRKGVDSRTAAPIKQDLSGEQAGLVNQPNITHVTSELPTQGGESIVSPNSRNQELLERYRDSALTNKVAFADQLPASKDENATAAMISTLTADYGERTFTVSEKAALMRIVFDLGLMSRHIVIARDFLVQGSNPDYWKSVRTWRNEVIEYDEYQNVVMAGQCLMALGTGGQEEVMAMAKSHKESPTEYTKALASFVVSSVFKFQLSKSGITEPDDVNVYEAWGEKDGKEWNEWNKTLKNIK